MTEMAKPPTKGARSVGELQTDAIVFEGSGPEPRASSLLAGSFFKPADEKERSAIARSKQINWVIEITQIGSVCIPGFSLLTSCGSKDFRRSVQGNSSRSRGAGKKEQGITRHLHKVGGRSVQVSESRREFEVRLTEEERVRLQLPDCLVGTLSVDIVTHDGGRHIHAEGEFGEAVALHRNDCGQLSYKNEFRFFFERAKSLPGHVRLHVQLPDSSGGKFLLPLLSNSSSGASAVSGTRTPDVTPTQQLDFVPHQMPSYLEDLVPAVSSLPPLTLSTADVTQSTGGVSNCSPFPASPFPQESLQSPVGPSSANMPSFGVFPDFKPTSDVCKLLDPFDPFDFSYLDSLSSDNTFDGSLSTTERTWRDFFVNRASCAEIRKISDNKDLPLDLSDAPSDFF
ncbi:MAG: hypothetical protein MHM6MM_001802 [Cercozoa sp. M6MM]